MPHDDPAGLVAELRAEVARRVPDDVEVRATDDGFAVAYADAWVTRGPDGVSASALRSVVRCDPATLTLRIEDVVAGAGVGRSGRLVRGGFRGQATGSGSRSVYGRRPDGSHGLLTRARGRGPDALHRAIRAAGGELGWQEKQPWSVTVARVAAAVGAGGALVTVLVLALAAATGRLT